MNIPVGQVMAAVLRDEAKDIFEGRGPWLGLQTMCRSCYRRTADLEDSYCPDCNGTRDEEAYHRRRRLAQAELHRKMAVLHPEDAEWFLEQATRLEVGK